MLLDQDKFEPPDSVTLHSGASIPENIAFKASPPNSLGTLRSIQSIARGKVEIRSFIDWLTLPLFVSPLILAGFCFWLLETSTAVSIGIAFLGAMIAAVAIATRSRRPTSIETFVGGLGIARLSHYVRSGRDDTVTESLFFKDVTEMRYEITDFHTQFGYGGSNFAFRWLNGNGHVVFSTYGAFYCSDDAIPDDSEYHFATAAKSAWNSFLTSRLTDEIKSTGECRFRVFDTDEIAVGYGYLRCTFAGKATRLLPSDLCVLAVSDGALHIETHTQKWYRNSRICRINCGRISNIDHLFKMLKDDGGFSFSDA